MTQEQKLQIAAMNAKGMTLEEMASESGIPSDEIESFLAERGKQPAKSKKTKTSKKSGAPKGRHHFKATPEIEAEMMEMHKQGYTSMAIADHFGCCVETVVYRLKKYRQEQESAAEPEITKEQGESPVPADDLLTEFKQLMKKIFDAAIECNLTEDLFTLTEGYKKLKTVVETVSKAEGETNG